MRSLRYLNSILTVLAVLLALQLWTAWTLGPSGETPAGAAPQNLITAPTGTGGATTGAHSPGLIDQGAQLQQQIDLLKQISKQTEDLVDLFKTGKAQMQVKKAAAEGEEKPKG